MAKVVFYEKPGCINNTRQKALLQAAGHDIEAHNLLTEDWTDDRLRPFFGLRSVAEWFNGSAPEVKAGIVNPAELDPSTALALMRQNPLLIRRPLIQVGDRQEAGFNQTLIDEWIGLQPKNVSQSTTNQSLISQDLETCPRTHSESI